MKETQSRRMSLLYWWHRPARDTAYWGQAGDGAGIGAGCADCTVGGLAVRGGWIERSTPTTPCWVGFGTPRTVTLPFPVAVVVAMAVTAWVVTVGGRRAVKVTSFPYEVPAELVA